MKMSFKWIVFAFFLLSTSYAQDEADPSEGEEQAGNEGGVEQAGNEGEAGQVAIQDEGRVKMQGRPFASTPQPVQLSPECVDFQQKVEFSVRNKTGECYETCKTVVMSKQINTEMDQIMVSLEPLLKCLWGVMKRTDLGNEVFNICEAKSEPGTCNEVTEMMKLWCSSENIMRRCDNFRGHAGKPMRPEDYKESDEAANPDDNQVQAF